MISLDTLFRCPKDLIFQNIKQLLPPASVDIIFYKPCLDHLTMKKTFWNASTRLKDSGLFCIQCMPENLSNIIKHIQESGYDFGVHYFVDNKTVVVYVCAYRNVSYRSEIFGLVRINRWEDIVLELIKYTNTSDVALILGDFMLPYVPIIKETNRYIIAVGDDDILCEIAKNAGLKEEFIL